MRTILCLAAFLACGGCLTQQVYEGTKRPAADVAHISGDLRFTAGVPLSVILRKVDDYALSVSESGVDVLPGRHTLLADCLIRETGGATRLSLDVEVDAGHRYKLMVDTAPGLRECSAIRLEAHD